MFEMNEARYDEACPQGFQTAEYVQKHGQLDCVVEQGNLRRMLISVLSILWTARQATPQALNPEAKVLFNPFSLIRVTTHLTRLLILSTARREQ